MPLSLTNLPLGHRNVGFFPLPNAPRTGLGRSHGFEIVASYTTRTTVAESEKRLATLIREKDHAANNVLLISVGAPVHGLSIIADEVVVGPDLLDYMEFPAPRYLERILLHRWSHGDVYELFPTLACLAQPVIDLTEGGVVLVPARDIPDQIWDRACPCANGQQFATCHGAL